MVRKSDGLIFAGALLFLVVPAQAQFSSGMNWVINRTRVPAIIQCPGCGDAGDADGDDAAAQSVPNPPVTRPRPPVDAGNLIYRPSLAVRQRNVAEFLSKAPVEAVAGGDIIEQVGARMRGVGLGANNIADAYTVWLIGSWEAVHQRDLGSDPALYQGVNRHVKRTLLASPAVMALDNGGKQTMAEALLLQSVLTASMVDASAGNPAQRREVADAVAQGGAQMGLDLRTMRLSAAGIGYQGKKAR